MVNHWQGNSLLGRVLFANGSEIIYTITITVSSSENEISLSIFGGFATTATTTVNGIFITITNQKNTDGRKWIAFRNVLTTTHNTYNQVTF